MSFWSTVKSWIPTFVIAALILVFNIVFVYVPVSRIERSVTLQLTRINTMEDNIEQAEVELCQNRVVRTLLPNFCGKVIA